MVGRILYQDPAGPVVPRFPWLDSVCTATKVRASLQELVSKSCWVLGTVQDLHVTESTTIGPLKRMFIKRVSYPIQKCALG